MIRYPSDRAIANIFLPIHLVGRSWVRSDGSGPAGIVAPEA
jgi:hypothetical protein